MEHRKFYITTAIDYVNSLPHIGTAYEKIAADCIARAMRLLGHDVRFCIGSDEHSINVKKKAIEEGLTPQAYCDGMVPRFLDIWKKLSISNDDFIRTTEPRHTAAVTRLFASIMERGDIYTSVYKGWYCEGCEAFIQEKDLVEGHCPNHMKPPAWIEEENYFFRLSAYGDRLLEHIRANPGFIQPASRRNEIIRLIEGGLDDISVSRSGFDWGIPLPDDDAHVVYVWFDALINYISALGYGSDDDALFQRYWPADVHVIGKDITRFHCVIWPAMLLAAGFTTEQLPRTVFGHGFIYHRGEKMSKSLGNVVSPLDIADRFGPDPLRYFLLREVVFGQDGDFTFERFIERYNSDLANDLGNLVTRTLTMIHRYLDGVLPDDATPGDNGLSHQFGDVLGRWKKAFDAYDISGACDAAWAHVREANRVIEDRAPWKLAKDPAKRRELVEVLCDLATTVIGIARLLSPFMPDKCDRILTLFGCQGSGPERIDDPDFGTDIAELAPTGVKLGDPEVLFPRIDKSENGEGSATSAAPAPAKTTSPAQAPATEAPADDDTKAVIAIDDFIKLDIRIGTITHAERVAKSDKLLRLAIDDGMGGRTILAGLGKHYAPGDLAGRQVAFIANLKPRKMMGEMSEGMVLAAGDGTSLAVLDPEKPVAPGSKVS